MTTVTVDEAQSELTNLIDRVAEGEEVVIARGGRPVAKIVRAGEQVPPKKKRELGLDRGKIWIADDFDAPLPPEIQKYFE